MATKKIKYKGWQIVWNEEAKEHDLFSPNELINPVGFRESDISIPDLKEAKYFIDKY